MSPQITKIKDDKIMLIFGEPNASRSNLLREIVHQKQDIPMCVIISATEEEQNYDQKCAIHREYDDDLIQKIFNRQKELMNKWSKNKEVDPRIILVFDDIFDEMDSWKNNKYIRALFTNGRLYKITLVIISSHIFSLTPSFSTNVDYVFMMYENDNNNRKLLYDNYAKNAGIPHELFSQHAGQLLIDKTSDTEMICALSFK